MTSTRFFTLWLIAGLAVFGCGKSSPPDSPEIPAVETASDPGEDPAGEVAEEEPANVDEPENAVTEVEPEPDVTVVETPGEEDENPFTGPAIELNPPANAPEPETSDGGPSDLPPEAAAIDGAANPEPAEPKPSLKAVIGSVGRALSSQVEDSDDGQGGSILGSLGRALGKGVEAASSIAAEPDDQP